mgnify:CR=1 FL=1
MGISEALREELKFGDANVWVPLGAVVLVPPYDGISQAFVEPPKLEEARDGIGLVAVDAGAKRFVPVLPADPVLNQSLISAI